MALSLEGLHATMATCCLVPFPDSPLCALDALAVRFFLLFLFSALSCLRFPLCKKRVYRYNPVNSGSTNPLESSPPPQICLLLPPPFLCSVSPYGRTTLLPTTPSSMNVRISGPFSFLPSTCPVFPALPQHENMFSDEKIDRS